MSILARPAQDLDVIVIGELNADLILTGDTEPQFGQVEKLIDDASLVLGSSSAIFACGTARLGLRTAFVGKVGDDALGRFVLSQLEARSVDISRVIVDATLKTGLSVILSRGNDRAILTYSGCIKALRYDEIDFGLVARGRHLHVGAYYLLDSLQPDVPRLFERAHELGLTTSIDTNYDPSGRWGGGLIDALQRADIAFPNETELLAITQAPTIDAGIDSLARMSPTVAVKLGREGALGVRGAFRCRAEGLHMTVADTVGAGDSFDAGFVYAHLQGWDLQRALRMACVCGSLSTRATGGTAGQATLQEALAKL
jgi:sugar/nucleoside kinase (ribokinase family)